MSRTAVRLTERAARRESGSHEVCAEPGEPGRQAASEGSLREPEWLIPVFSLCGTPVFQPSKRQWREHFTNTGNASPNVHQALHT